MDGAPKRSRTDAQGYLVSLVAQAVPDIQFKSRFYYILPVVSSGALTLRSRLGRLLAEADRPAFSGVREASEVRAHGLLLGLRGRGGEVETTPDDLLLGLGQHLWEENLKDHDEVALAAGTVRKPLLVDGHHVARLNDVGDGNAQRPLVQRLQVNAEPGQRLDQRYLNLEDQVRPVPLEHGVVLFLHSAHDTSYHQC